MMVSSVISNKHTFIPAHCILVPTPQPKTELFCVAPVVLELTLYTRSASAFQLKVCNIKADILIVPFQFSAGSRTSYIIIFFFNFLQYSCQKVFYYVVNQLFANSGICSLISCLFEVGDTQDKKPDRCQPASQPEK